MRIITGLLLLMVPFLSQAKERIPKSIYGFKVQGLDGKTIDFSKFKGKKILIVNTPSEADTRPQYAELEALYQKYKGKLVIVGFLDDDFGPPPGSKKEVDFSKKNYHVTFPMAAHIVVAGNNPAPIYKWLLNSKYNKHKDTQIKWDFQKYLLNEQGELVADFEPNTHVTEKEVIDAIEK